MRPLRLDAVVTVRAATTHLTAGHAELRDRRHEAFAAAALQPGGTATRQARVDGRTSLRKGMTAVWRGPCDNRRLSVLWRAAVDCLPGACIRPWRCPCGEDAAPTAQPRVHTLWDCPVAQAVVAQLSAAVAPVVVTRASVWLLTSPAQAVDNDVWRTVSALALDAMEQGRTQLWATAHSAADADALGGPPTVDATGVAAAGRAASAFFWSSVESFAAAAGAVGGFADLGEAHPFVRQQEGELRVNIPPLA